MNLFNYKVADKHYHYIRNLHSAFRVAGQKINDPIEKRHFRTSNKIPVSYPCILLDPYLFMDGLKQVIKYLGLTRQSVGNTRFIDVGCGIGEKVFLAQSAGLSAHGLEFRQQLITGAKKMFAEYGIDRVASNTFIKGDALEFKDYDKFNIIYFYCPFRDVKHEVKLEKRIMRLAKPGTIVIGYLTDYFIKNMPGWKSINENIWQKL